MVSFQSQLDAKSKKLESTSSQLKKAEKTLEEIDQDQVAQQNGNHPSRQSFSMTTPLKSKPADQQQKYIQELEAQKRELEIKVFELSSGATDTKDFAENVGENTTNANNNPFDETPLPTSRKNLDFGFTAIANRNKSSSISFGSMAVENNEQPTPTVFKTPLKSKENIGGVSSTNADLQDAGLVKELKRKLTAENQTNSRLNIEINDLKSNLEQFKEKLKISDCQRVNSESAKQVHRY